MMELLKQQGFWTIFGVIIGVAATALLHQRQYWRQRRTAQMLVATGFRYWMNRAMENLYATRNWMKSGGQGGVSHSRIRHFPFEETLDTVSLLEHQTATAIFDLIHRKNSANAEIRSVAEFEGGEEALERYCRLSAEICLVALPIYTAMAKRLRWSEEILSKRNIEVLNKESERAARDDRLSDVQL